MERNAGLTIFTIPKTFTGHNSVIQRNAIRSWLQLVPRCQILLFGDDPGVAENAREHGIEHVPSIETNQHGTPLLSDAFKKAQEMAKHDKLLFVNADIILFQDIVEAARTIGLSRYLLCGRRWDLEISEEVDFGGASWKAMLKEKIAAEGVLHGPSGMDYFIFPRNTIEMPPFAVGRPGWDSWLVFNTRCRGIPVVNCTEVIDIIHQNHDYSHSKYGGKKRVDGPEMEENIRIAGGLTNMMTLRDANWLLTEDGLKRPALTKLLYSAISSWYPWRLLLATKRKLHYLGGRN
jgi:hypothetical protein